MVLRFDVAAMQAHGVNPMLTMGVGSRSPCMARVADRWAGILSGPY